MNGSNGEAMPSWLKGLVPLVLQHGAAAFIALFLVWFVTQRLTSDIARVEAQVEIHNRTVTAAGETMRRYAAEHELRTRVLIRR